MNIVLAGGGTAGHVNPLLAVAAELSKKSHSVTIVGTEEGLETELVPAAGYQLETILRVPFPRRPNLYMLRFPAAFAAATKAAVALLEKTEADVVIGFGGYVSTPFYRAAKKLNIPLAIHEQNARPGLANRLGARWADLVGLTFSGTPLEAKKGRTEVVGLPLRPAIHALAQNRATGLSDQLRQKAAQSLGVNPELPTVVVTGGSLGALHLNEAFAAAVPTLPPELQVIHLTGKGKSGLVKDSVSKANRDNYLVLEYSMEMEQVLACADLVVCRSGAGTVAEMTALGLPAVYVPLPIGNGEQKLNAAEVVAAGGAKLVSDRDFSAKTIGDVVVPWALDKARLQESALAAARCGRRDAASSFASLVEQLR
ncbi:undecaprenyldiphospho-muramoylpentapeptide beta-N-acetylglucosaminyltransferase [Boudabousia marimammalium]|uniref:UDP-N-acetylglucosamine--N-acetylmuramyl-(pentapeptide) pyrophosphoryl-undecaprenol N-acetylglucosamine transferase n=1 Tax=Boudabousia marimammalium TaxID=156892 RepID=A0A1Q5PP08_9ACTO|nr:undecaprenyldiphospho-muramoylpentapeptide beta-N-acetylglucosaminyltransferase [Boudabousia marimammalium]OKL49242.1 undecaprenyldiphospho-muramoylpentapeptide beta-N-acetylglucosaminyltransferase [Boudabousia marimammalium]